MKNFWDWFYKEWDPDIDFFAQIVGYIVICAFGVTFIIYMLNYIITTIKGWL
jgi:hypothetical protein